MAVGQALTLLSALLLQSSDCQGSLDNAPFFRLVNLYRRGHSDEAISELGRLNRRIAERLIERGAPGIEDRCLEAASLLETELAMDLAEKARWELADSHFDQAWQMSFLIETPGARLQFQRDWLLAAGLFYQELIFVQAPDEAFPRANRYLHDAVRLYPTDPEVLLAAGGLLEWSGSLRQGDTSHLKEAEELYSRALRLTPLDPEILLRNGWALEKLGRYSEAAEPLRRVLELEARDDLVYRSRMALGLLAERAGQLTDAETEYEAARNVIPSWQVAHVALAHVLHEQGSHGKAREVLDGALALSARRADETFGGFWSYELGIALRFEPLFHRMRVAVLP